MLITAHDVTDVTLRPVALFADWLRWSRIGFSDLDRPIEIISEGVIELLHAVDFVLKYAAAPGPTWHATQSTFACGVCCEATNSGSIGK